MKSFKIAALLVAWAFVARAEDKPDRFAKAMGFVQKAKQAIVAKQAQLAITALQNAIAELQVGLEKFLPMIEGWKRDKPRVQAGTQVGNDGQRFQWQNATAGYIGPNGERIQVTITSSPQMVKAQRQALEAQAGMVQMYKNLPEIDAELIKEGDWTAILIASKKGNPNCMLTGAHDLVVVSIQARNSADMAPVKLIWSKSDRAGLVVALGGK